MTPFGLPPWLMLLWLFVLGAVLGSFLNVCIYRIPHHERLLDQLRGLWSPPSSCPRCRRRIPLRDNIPIIGWLLLHGRCRFCRTWISPRYPLIELGNGLLFVVVYWFVVPLEWGATIRDSAVHSDFGLGYTIAWSDVAVLHWRYFHLMMLLQALVVATFIDFDHMIIPDGATVPAMIVGVLVGWVVPQVHLVPLWFEGPVLYVPAWISQSPHLHGLLVGLVGLVAGGATVWGVRLIGQWVLRREAMGFGDVVLMALIGSFLGWQPVIVVFFLGPLCALAVVAVSWAVRRDREIPYGPYLSLAALLLILGWRQLWPLAERILLLLGPLVLAFAVFAAAMLALCLLAVQLVKRLLGIPLYPDEDHEEWTSADQLTHFAGETVDLQQGRWRTEQWPGTLAARGTAYEDRWRRSSAADGPQNGRHRLRG